MKLSKCRPVFVFLLSVFLGGRLHGAQGESSGSVITSISVDASRPAGGKIPRSIFGTFLEPIGNSTYGGLWAEILQNPSFEGGLWSAQRIAEMIRDEPLLARSSEMALPLPWEPLDYAQGSRYAPEWNDAANSYRSLLVMALPDKQTGIRQKVYLPIHRVLHYQGSIYIKYLSGPGEAEVSLREHDRTDKILVSRKIPLTGNDWQRYEFALDLSPHQLRPLQPADFVIAVSNETRVLVDQASLVPGDALDGMDPDMISMARALRTSVVRFGGNFTSAYHWRDGVGPRDKRVSMLNIAWGIPEYNQFGTDEFLRFCQHIDAQPQIALNLGTGTPEEAAAWVQYVNAHWGDHSGGLLWELGNELWGSFQVGYPTLPKVTERTQAFRAAVKRVDPHARLIATGGDPDGFEAWNAAQLATGSNTFDYLSTHFVVTTGATVAQNPSPEFVARATFALPVELERRLRKMHQQIQDSPLHNSVNTAFTEWLFYAPDDTYPRYDNMGGAIATAGFLNMLLRNADIVPVSDMTGLVEFGGIWKKRGKVFGVPSYWAFKMYSTADVNRPIEARTEGESYNVEQGSNRLPNIADVPYLDVVATLNDSGSTLTLFCVNRDLSRDIPARIQIAGFRPGSVAHASSLYAGSIYEKNDEVQPEHIHPEESSFPISSPDFKYTFRPASLTVITLTK
jgi:alpha-N-arabinofuranosidase